MTPSTAQSIARSWNATPSQYRQAAQVLAREVDRLNDRHERVMREYVAAVAERDEWRGMVADTVPVLELASKLRVVPS